MHQQLIDRIAQRVGIPPEKAQAAADTVVGYLKEKLPGPVASQLDNVMSGQDSGAGQSGGMADAAKNLGGMFGGKQ